MLSLFHHRLKRISKRIGPGVITGASDDDPSGILTFLIVGAQTGLSLLWITLLTIPMMVSVQEMCARIGLVTNRGLMGNMKLHIPKAILYLVAILLFAANTFNLAADLAGMVGTLRLLLPLPEILLGSLLVGIVLASLIFFSYRKLARIFRWLTLPLLAYIGSALLSDLSLKDMISHTLFPQVEFNRTTLIMITALLGTIISPYLFFWQTSEEVEEKRLEKEPPISREIKDMRFDVLLGMVFSNLVSYFIIAAAAATFNHQGLLNITSLQQATTSLVPLAGHLATILFAIGILGTGMLAIPVLAGSAAYVVAESFGWPEGLNRKFREAPQFYLTIIVCTLLGLSLSLFQLDPIKLLFYTALIYGVLSPILILLILYIGNNRSLMGDQINGPISNFLNFGTFAVMAIAATSLIFIH